MSVEGPLKDLLDGQPKGPSITEGVKREESSKDHLQKP